LEKILKSHWGKPKGTPTHPQPTPTNPNGGSETGCLIDVTRTSNHKKIIFED